MIPDSTLRLIQAFMADGADFATLRKMAMSCDPIGDAPCPGCGQTVLYAWDDAMNVIALDRDDTGPVTVEWDGNRLPWCRPADAQLALGEVLCRPHAPACPWQAPVTPITSARSHGTQASTRGRTA